MDASFTCTNKLLELCNAGSFPDEISSQSQINELQNKAFHELNSNLRNREYGLLLNYLKQFLTINSDTNWNLHNQFHVDSFEFIKIVLNNSINEHKTKFRQQLGGNLKPESSKITDLFLFMETIDKDSRENMLEDNKQLLSYYCSLTEDYDHDDEYLKNVYLKKVSLLEDYFTAFKSEGKDVLLEMIPFIESEFESNLDNNDFIGKKCFLSGLALSVITKDFYEQFDLKLLFASYNLIEYVENYSIIEFNLAIQFYKQFFNTVVKRKSLYKYLKLVMMDVVSQIVKILSNSSEFSIIESYSKSYIFQILSKVSILDGKLLNSLLTSDDISLKNDSEYKYLIEFYSFLEPSFIIAFYKQELKKIFSIQRFAINIYNNIPVMRNICANEELWQFIIEPVLPLCKSLPILEQLVLLEKFSQYEHCLSTLLKQETWIFQSLFIDILDIEMLTLKENALSSLLIKNGEFVRETDPVFHKKLKATIFGNDREAKVSVATMAK
ncbi:hypothetical protein QEN19_003227 [Hanseniaspora menglaensis]